jgi:hypothetical protein
MFMDEHRRKVWDDIRQQDFRALGRFLSPDVFAEAAQRAGLVFGKGPLYIVNLVWLGIAAAIHRTENFSGVLTLTLKLLADQESFAATSVGRAQRQGQKRSRRRRRRRSRHDPRRDDPTVVSEEAFTKARRLMPITYWMALLLLLNKRFEEAHGQQLCWKGLRLLALDGTCINLPRWRWLRDYYGSAKNGRGKKKTQARMVLLQFPLARLPYAYEVAPLSTGEVTLARRLAEHLRRNDLALLDRGFFSYGLLWRIQSRGAYFAIRLKGKIRMRTLQRLGDKDRLVRWKPADTRGKWKKEGWPLSIDLRLIRYQIRGFRATALLTNMLNAQKIPREDWVRLTTTCEVGRPLQPGLYHRRWEIETTFFELKVTQGMEGSLRSRTPDGIEYEIAGHVLLYLLVRWLMVEAAVEHGLDPLRLSFTEARRELQIMQVALLMASPGWATRVLLPRLLQRIAAHVVPYRPGRSFPRPKDGRIKDRGHGQKQRPAKLKRSQG